MKNKTKRIEPKIKYIDTTIGEENKLKREVKEKLENKTKEIKADIKKDLLDIVVPKTDIRFKTGIDTENYRKNILSLLVDLETYIKKNFVAKGELQDWCAKTWAWGKDYTVSVTITEKDFKELLKSLE